MFHIKTNYSIISEKSEFLKHVLTKHIVGLNIAAGLYPNQSLFGQSIVVGNDQNPTPKKFVISYIERENFKTLNLDEEPLPILYEVLKVDNKEYKTYIRNRVYKNKNIKLNSLYYYMILLRDCINKDDSFNYTKADLIVDTYSYESTSSTLDKYKALNSYVTNPSEATLFTLVKVFSQGDDVKKRLTNVAYHMKSILDDTVPDYIKSRVTFPQDPTTTLNYLMLAAEIATFETFDEFINNMINRLVD